MVMATLITSVGQADGEKVPLGKLPKAVADAARKRFPKLDVKEAAKENTEDKKLAEVVVSPEGNITKTEGKPSSDQKSRPVECRTEVAWDCAC
jgi:hypothetical protein